MEIQRTSFMSNVNRLIVKCAQPCLLGVFLLLMVGPRVAEATDYTQQLLNTRLFPQPLVWVGQTPPTESESAELWSAFGVDQRRSISDSVDQLEEFLNSHPQSAWAPSLNCDLGMYYFKQGRFSLALSHWQAAWDVTKNMSDIHGKHVADQALVHRLHLLCSLGRIDELKTLFSETKGRKLSGPLQQMYNQSQEAYSTMRAQPGIAYRCGTYAMNHIIRVIYGTNNIAIMNDPSPQTGFSMAMLMGLAKKYNYNFVAVQRPNGSKELVVPSVVHWKLNHYAAILAKKGNRYEVADPTFELDTWLTANAINAECSGQFIVSAKQVPTGWQPLSSEQAGQIFGRGYTGNFIKPPNPPCNTCPCPPGSAGGGGNGGGGGGGPGSGCPICRHGRPAVGGMPDWTVLEPYVDVWVNDEPLAYQPATGPRIAFQIHYWQRDDASVDPDVYGMGASWNFNWLSYIAYTNAENSGPDILYSAGGGQKSYDTWDGTTPNYFDNTRLLEETNSNGNPTDFKLIHRSGAVDVYGFLRTNLDGSLSQAFLTQKIDANGRTTTFIYAPYNPTNTVVQLKYVVDADGGTNSIGYTSISGVSDYLISSVTNRYQQSCHFAYAPDGYLTNVTDVGDISSSFSYDPNQSYWMTNMTTPYGPTTFAYTDEPSFPDDYSVTRAVIVTEPNNARQMFMFREDSYYLNNSGYVPLIPYSYTDPSNVPANPPAGSTLDNGGYMYYRNTYCWGPQQFDHLSSSFQSSGPSWDFTQLSTNDYLLARLRHWNHSDGPNLGNSLSMERDFSPNGQTSGKMTWYDYPGKPGFNVQGTSAFPSLVLKVLPDGSEWYREYQYDQFGNRTKVISTWSANGQTLLRTNSYVYSTNGVDLLLAIGPDGVTNAAYGYNANHRILAMTNAVGEVTRYTYNTDEQLTSITAPTGLVTTNIYNSDGYLAQRIVEGFSTNSYTYTNGLVYTHTDERGLTVTNSWDDLNRLTNVAYPDGTSVSYLYNKLDLAKVIDRMGFTTSYGYNAIRQMVVQTNALNNVTYYNYCPCGALDTIIDALTNVTEFNHDLQGNITNIVYPDGYTVSKQYNAIRQLVRQTDSGGDVQTYTYNNQGLLTCISNTVGRVAAYAYDIKDRLTNSIDANDVSVNMTYDPLDRLLTRSYPDGGVEKFGYTFGVSGPTAYTNQIGDVTLYGYDAMNQKTNEITVGVTTNAFTYNGAGDLLTLTDGKDQTTTWGYDEFGRVTNKVDAADNVIFAYQYDDDNRLTNRWTPAKGNTAYGYDAVGNLTSVTYEHSHPIYYFYDALNRLTNMVDAVGTTVYGYNAAGQLLSENGPWADDTVSYTYTNRLRTGLSLSEPGGGVWTNRYSYDAMRRLTRVVSPAGTFGYTYDPVQLTRMDELTLPGGAFIANSYNSVGRLKTTRLQSSVTSNVNNVMDSYAYGYNQAGERTNVVRLTGNSVSYGYDHAGQLTSATGQEANGVSRLNEQFGYGYDAAGNLNFRTNNALIQNFFVNSLNELTAATHSGTLTVAGVTTTLATNVTVNGSNAVLYADATFASTNQIIVTGLNNYTAIGQNSAGQTSSNTVALFLPARAHFTYDLNGNLLSEWSPAGGTNRQFEYDDENQLTSVYVTNLWRDDFVYDGKMRRRIETNSVWNGSTWVATNVTYFVYDGNVVIQERNSNNVPVVTYTRGNDLSGSLQGAGGIGGLLARTDTNSTAFYHADGNGNVTCMIYTNQTIAAKYLYDPYGNTLAMSGPLADANTYRFSSKEWDQNSGLYYYLYRFYDPNLQRWLNRDPLGRLGALNLYEFVANNPVNFVDPLGLQEEGAAELAADPTLLMDDNELAAYRAEQAAKKAAEEAQKKLASECKRMSEKELKKEVGDIHKAKDIMKKQFGKQLKGDKNFDVMVDKAGNVVLKGNQSGTLVPTGVPPSAFKP